MSLIYHAFGIPYGTALELLISRGMPRIDAQRALESLESQLAEDLKRIANSADLLPTFGADAGRAAAILQEKTRKP